VSSAALSGSGMERSIESRLSSSNPSRELWGTGVGAAGAGVASEGVGGTETMVLALRSGCAAVRDAVVAERGCGACWSCASCASSSSSQCLICRWYCMILRAFCVLGVAGKSQRMAPTGLVAHTRLSRYRNALFRVVVSVQLRDATRDGRLLPRRKLMFAACASGLCGDALFVLGVEGDFRGIVARVDDIRPSRRDRGGRVREHFDVRHGGDVGEDGEQVPVGAMVIHTSQSHDDALGAARPTARGT